MRLDRGLLGDQRLARLRIEEPESGALLVEGGEGAPMPLGAFVHAS